MNVSFNQPAFIPWAGFFARLLYADRMVLLDDTLLGRGFTFVNRNRLKGPQGEIWLTVPLKRKGRGDQKIKDLEIYERARWSRNFLLTLKHYYGKSLYLKPILEEIEAALDTAEEAFLPMVLDHITIIRKGFAIERDIVLQSKIGVAGKGTLLLVSLAKELGADEVVLPYFSEKAVECERFKKENIAVKFLRYDQPPYPQFWGCFIKNLSALDLLLCCGREGKAVIEKGSHPAERKLASVRWTPGLK